MNTINYMKIRFPKTTLKQFVLICNLIFTKKASISRDQPFYGNNTVLRWRLHLAPKAPTAFAFLGGCFDHVSLLFTPVTRRAIPVSFALIVAVVIERAVSVRQDIDRSLLSAPVPWRAITVRKHGARFLDHRLANSAPVAVKKKKKKERYFNINTSILLTNCPCALLTTIVGRIYLADPFKTYKEVV